MEVTEITVTEQRKHMCGVERRTDQEPQKLRQFTKLGVVPDDGAIGASKRVGLTN